MQEKKFTEIIVPQEWFEELLVRVKKFEKELKKDYIENKNNIRFAAAGLIGYASSADSILENNKRIFID